MNSPSLSVPRNDGSLEVTVVPKNHSNGGTGNIQYMSGRVKKNDGRGCQAVPGLQEHDTTNASQKVMVVF
jgi:hypothetical protein